MNVNNLIKIIGILLLLIVYASCSDGLVTSELFLGDCTTSERFLVVKTYAGMGNRLRILASAKIMAALTDRELLVDWPVIDNEMPGRWKDFFRNSLTMYEDSSLAKQGCLLQKIESAEPGDPIIKNLGSQNDGEGQKRLSKITEDNEPIVYFGTSLNFQPDDKYISNQEYHERYSIFYQNLDPTVWVTQQIKSFKKDHDLENKFMIGVHYRSWATGTPDETQGVTQDLNYKYLPLFISEMQTWLAKTLAETDNKPVAFYLASDSTKVKDEILATPGFKDKVFFSDLPIERSTIRGQESALVDWYLLGNSNFIIGTYQSSFSDEARYLTRQKYKKNIGDAAYKP